MRSRRSAAGGRGVPHLAAGFTLVEVLIAIFVITIGIIAAFGLLIPSLRVAGAGVENSIAATLAQSVYEAMRNGVQTRAFVINENGNNVRGFLLVHPGVLDPGPQLNPPPLPAPGTANGGSAADLTALRASDFTIFVPSQPLPVGTPQPRFVFPRPLGATAENGWPGTDDFLPAGTAGFGGEQVQLNVQRVYSLVNTRVPPPLPGQPPEATDQYGFAVVVNRAIAPGFPAGTVWFNNGVPIPGVYPPGAAGPGVNIFPDGLLQVEVLVYRNFDKSPTSRFHEPVPGGRFIGLLALGP
jgi:prepilin-type N-terminal cleavage/methylation domain-containing protein